jgi:hypothetical protein
MNYLWFCIDYFPAETVMICYLPLQCTKDGFYIIICAPNAPVVLSHQLVKLRAIADKVTMGALVKFTTCKV